MHLWKSILLFSSQCFLVLRGSLKQFRSSTGEPVCASARVAGILSAFDIALGSVLIGLSN